MDYMTASETALAWGVSKRRVTTLCSSGRIAGAQKVGGFWIVPVGAKKPFDDRIKSGKYALSVNSPET